MNPYLPQQADAITQQVTNNLQRNILPGINSDAMAAGGYGGSRQGIAQGNAIGQTDQGLSQALANLYGQSYQFDQGNQTQQLGIGANFALGLGSQALQGQNQQNQFYTQQRSLDQSGAQLGANLFNGGNAGYLGQGTGVYGIGTTQQQAPWGVTSNFGNTLSPFSGLGGSQIQTQNSNPIANGLGGALAGAQLGKIATPWWQGLGMGGGSTTLQGNGVPDNAYSNFYGGGG